MTEAMTVQNQAFIQSVTATYGLLIALTNKFHHTVPYLAEQYTIDLHMAREA